MIRNADKSKPIIIATDILGHFNTTVLFEGQIYILDSLSTYMDTKHDSKIVECIEYLYKQSFLIHDWCIYCWFDKIVIIELIKR